MGVVVGGIGVAVEFLWYYVYRGGIFL